MAALICAVTSIGFFFIPMDPKYIWVMVATVILTSIGIGLYSPLLWSIFSIFPAAIALLIILLLTLYPIKK